MRLLSSMQASVFCVEYNCNHAIEKKNNIMTICSSVTKDNCMQNGTTIECMECVEWKIP